MQESKQDITKSLSFVKMAEKVRDWRYTHLLHTKSVSFVKMAENVRD